MMHIPPFKPSLTERDGELYYDDGRVYGYIVPCKRNGNLSIQEWNSSFHGLGFTRDALRWLKTQATSLSANGIGLIEEGFEPEGSASYWLKMHAEGLVDELIDDDGFNVTPATESGTEPNDEELDEFTLNLVLKSAEQNLEKICAALLSNAPNESRAIKARRKLCVYPLLDAFAKGRLAIRSEPLEDSDSLYDLLGSNPDRHASIMKGIFALQGAASVEMASIFHRRYPELRLVRISKTATESSYLVNNKNQVLTPNGVLSIRDAIGLEAADLFVADEAAELLIPVADVKAIEVIEQFSWIAQLMAEEDGLVIEIGSGVEPNP